MNITRLIILLFFVQFVSANWACKQNHQRQTGVIPAKQESPKLVTPNFDADSAYYFIQKQVDFGPRVPNTPAHDSCAKYLKQKLTQFTPHVMVQEAKVKAYNGQKLPMKNIIAEFYKEKPDRILLFAHWDTRPFADRCENPARRDDPILGANDGASGVGVLLEIARLISQSEPNIGIDIILFDVEDYGIPDHKEVEFKQDTWCLGSQYWSKKNHIKNYYARFGILLDMVGASNATFTREGISMHYAKFAVDKIWDVAATIGYSDYFIFEQTATITDDHYYVNKIAGIPSVDIIQYDHATKTKFGAYWHTHNDNMDVIDKNTLKAVGQTVLEVIYREK